jgi:DNA-directed RNA polymerase specialized sigma24 family protein
MTVSIWLIGTCNVLDTGSAVASPCVVRADAANERTPRPDGPSIALGEISKERPRRCVARDADMFSSIAFFGYSIVMKIDDENNASRRRRLGQKASDRGEYASKEEFASVFESERVGLQKLALLLTANPEAAKQCLIRASRECIASSSVSKEWAVSWTRRMVIRNAISLVVHPGGQSFVGTNDDAGDGLIAFSLDESLAAIATSESIRGLSEIERFVFVICVLERYSIHDCALLLGKSPREVNAVRRRVGSQVGPIDELGNSSRRIAMS